MPRPRAAREGRHTVRTEILGVGFDNVTKAEAVERACGMIEQGGFHYVVTPNAEFVQMAEKNEEFRSLLNGADLVIPDGIGVIKAAKILGRPLKERVPGVDFASALMDEMAGRGWKLFLLGAKPGVAEQAAANLAARHPGLVVCGTHDGYFQDDDSVCRAIRDAGADVALVCLGALKQEKWMKTFGPRSGAKLMAGLGGSLDVFAGIVERAPEAWQKAGCEWLYRLLKQPSRIGRMAKLPLFLVSAASARVRGK